MRPESPTDAPAAPLVAFALLTTVMAIFVAKRLVELMNTVDLGLPQSYVLVGTITGQPARWQGRGEGLYLVRVDADGTFSPVSLLPVRRRSITSLAAAYESPLAAAGHQRKIARSAARRVYAATQSDSEGSVICLRFAADQAPCVVVEAVVGPVGGTATIASAEDDLDTADSGDGGGGHLSHVAAVAGGWCAAAAVHTGDARLALLPAAERELGFRSTDRLIDGPAALCGVDGALATVGFGIDGGLGGSTECAIVACRDRLCQYAIAPRIGGGGHARDDAGSVVPIGALVGAVGWGGEGGAVVKAVSADAAALVLAADGETLFALLPNQGLLLGYSLRVSAPPVERCLLRLPRRRVDHESAAADGDNCGQPKPAASLVATADGCFIYAGCGCGDIAAVAVCGGEDGEPLGLELLACTSSGEGVCVGLALLGEDEELLVAAMGGSETSGRVVSFARCVETGELGAEPAHELGISSASCVLPLSWDGRYPSATA